MAAAADKARRPHRLSAAILLGLVVAAASTGGGQAGANAPAWRRAPSAADLKRFYPPRALESQVEGRASVTCIVRRDGKLDGCRLLREAPSGWGFGAAALQVADRAWLRAARRPRTFKLDLEFRLPPRA